MRYVNIPNVTFTDWNGNQNVIKDMREIPVYKTIFTLSVQSKYELDEISARTEIYGYESSAYAIHENNIVTMIENMKNPDVIRKLNIPLIEDVL